MGVVLQEMEALEEMQLFLNQHMALQFQEETDLRLIMFLVGQLILVAPVEFVYGGAGQSLQSGTTVTAPGLSANNTGSGGGGAGGA